MMERLASARSVLVKGMLGAHPIGDSVVLFSSN